MIRSCACQRESHCRTWQQTCLAATRSQHCVRRVCGACLGLFSWASIETPREGRSAFKLSDSALSLTMNTSYTQLYKSVYEPDVWLKAADGKSGPPVPALTSMLQALGSQKLTVLLAQGQSDREAAHAAQVADHRPAARPARPHPLRQHQPPRARRRVHAGGEAPPRPPRLPIAPRRRRAAPRRGAAAAQEAEAAGVAAAGAAVAHDAGDEEAAGARVLDAVERRLVSAAVRADEGVWTQRRELSLRRTDLTD